MVFDPNHPGKACHSGNDCWREFTTSTGDVAIIRGLRGHRRHKVDNCLDLQFWIECYFDKCDEENIPYTVQGLANCMEVDDQTIHNYMKDGHPYQRYLNKLKKHILQHRVEKMLGNKQNVAGAIFELKNMHGWEDKRTVESNVNMTVSGIVSLLTSADNSYEAIDADYDDISNYEIGANANHQISMSPPHVGAMIPIKSDT